jgi:hypothetical protein
MGHPVHGIYGPDQSGPGDSEVGFGPNRIIMDTAIYHLWYITCMTYEVEVSDEFRAWYEDLSEPEQNSVERVVMMLMEAGPALGYPQSTGVKGSKLSHMRELRIQHEGRQYRVLFAFDPTRTAFLLLGGDKTGDERRYEKMVPKADAIYMEHLKMIEKHPG